MTAKANISKVSDTFSNVCAVFKTSAVVFNNFVFTLVFDSVICIRTQEIEFSLVGG